MVSNEVVRPLAAVTLAFRFEASIFCKIQKRSNREVVGRKEAWTRVRPLNSSHPLTIVRYQEIKRRKWRHHNRHVAVSCRSGWRTRQSFNRQSFSPTTWWRFRAKIENVTEFASLSYSKCVFEDQGCARFGHDSDYLLFHGLRNPEKNRLSTASLTRSTRYMHFLTDVSYLYIKKRQLCVKESADTFWQWRNSMDFVGEKKREREREGKRISLYTHTMRMIFKRWSLRFRSERRSRPFLSPLPSSHRHCVLPSKDGSLALYRGRYKRKEQVLILEQENPDDPPSKCSPFFSDLPSFPTTTRFNGERSLTVSQTCTPVDSPNKLFAERKTRRKCALRETFCQRRG